MSFNPIYQNMIISAQNQYKILLWKFFFFFSSYQVFEIWSVFCTYSSSQLLLAMFQVWPCSTCVWWLLRWAAQL